MCTGCEGIQRGPAIVQLLPAQTPALQPAILCIIPTVAASNTCAPVGGYHLIAFEHKGLLLCLPFILHGEKTPLYCHNQMIW